MCLVSQSIGRPLPSFSTIESITSAVDIVLFSESSLPSVIGFKLRESIHEPLANFKNLMCDPPQKKLSELLQFTDDLVQ